MVARLTEPYLKARFCLWLIGRGATNIQVSVDGAEPEPDGFRRELIEQGWSHTHLARSKASWTGTYIHSASPCVISAVSKPGLDVIARVGDNVWASECKGEPSPSGLESGADLTYTYTALGQLIIGGGAHQPPPARLLLAIPASDRMTQFIEGAARNPLIRQAKVAIILVSHDGSVREVD